MVHTKRAENSFSPNTFNLDISGIRIITVLYNQEILNSNCYFIVSPLVGHYMLNFSKMK